MTSRTLLSLGLLLILAAVPACSNGGDGGDAQSATLGPSVAPPTIDTCTFAPPAPGIIGLGTVTLIGSNDTGRTVDTTSVAFDLLDATGAVTASAQTAVTAWRSGETISFETFPFGDKTAGDPVGCRFTEATAAPTAHDADLPVDAATCTVGAATGPIGGPPLTVDLSQVTGMPATADTLVTVALMENGSRVGERPLTVPTGQASASATLAAPRPGLTCEVVLAYAI